MTSVSRSRRDLPPKSSSPVHANSEGSASLPTAAIVGISIGAVLVITVVVVTVGLVAVTLRLYSYIGDSSFTVNFPTVEQER